MLVAVAVLVAVSVAAVSVAEPASLSPVHAACNAAFADEVAAYAIPVDASAAATKVANAADLAAAAEVESHKQPFLAALEA